MIVSIELNILEPDRVTKTIIPKHKGLVLERIIKTNRQKIYL